MSIRFNSVFALLAFIPALSVAQSQPPKAAYLADVTSSVIKSSATGRSYQISIALPAGYSKQHAPYPVLYAADANVQFGTLVETARVFAEIPELVIVGIGYPDSPQGFAWVPRALDLTVAPDPKAPGASGGAPEFLKFIRNDLIPHVEGAYNVSQDRAWFGHSFGGLFGVYALLNNEGLFRRFIIGSPSFWQGSQIISAAEKAFAATGKPLPAKVFFSVGLLSKTGTGAEWLAICGRSLRCSISGITKILNIRFSTSTVRRTCLSSRRPWAGDFVMSIRFRRRAHDRSNV